MKEERPSIFRLQGMCRALFTRRMRCWHELGSRDELSFAKLFLLASCLPNERAHSSHVCYVPSDCVRANVICPCCHYAIAAGSTYIFLFFCFYCFFHVIRYVHGRSSSEMRGGVMLSGAVAASCPLPTAAVEPFVVR